MPLQRREEAGSGTLARRGSIMSTRARSPRAPKVLRHLALLQGTPASLRAVREVRVEIEMIQPNEGEFTRAHLVLLLLIVVWFTGLAMYWAASLEPAL
jgi:hypothetical protein